MGLGGVQQDHASYSAVGRANCALKVTNSRPEGRANSRAVGRANSRAEGRASPSEVML